MNNIDAPPYPVAQDTFREVAGRFATGVTIITTTDSEGLAGTTASAVASLSLDPPMMLVCLNKTSATHDRIKASGVYGVNILAKEQNQIAFTFAKKGGDKFAGVSWSPAINGVPFIGGSLARVACRVVDTAEGGTHTIFIGEVVEADSTDTEPLTYYRGGFGRFEFDADATTYRELRRSVLQRRFAVGSPLDLGAVAAELRARPEFVDRAVARLISEGLLHPHRDEVIVAPLTAASVAVFFNAQASIETGVLDIQLANATDQQLSAIGAAGAALAAALDAPAADPADCLNAVSAVHAAIMGLSASRKLVEAYEEFSTAALWAALTAEAVEAEILDARSLIRLTQAIVARDTATARATVLSHASTVIAIARAEIERRGGQI